MKAMILAAGLGTRLKPYSDHIPKALFTINERPVLEITIETLQKAGCDAVMVNTHHHHHQIEALLGKTSFGIPVHTRYEPKILGTGGGIRNVADFWQNDSLLVINADIVCDIDLRRVYDFHRSHSAPVTMVMHDYKQFNSVHVDHNDYITGFKGMPHHTDHRILAFTGIHVLDPRVLDFLPPHGPAHIIDAYRQMIATGAGIKAYVAFKHQWYDIGTPAAYQTAVYDHMAPHAFAAAFGCRPTGIIQKQCLQGDGSDRQWTRLRYEDQTLIMADHGIRTKKGVQEVDAYVAIGAHLAARNVAVPSIYAFDRLAGIVFLEDLGNTHLQSCIDTQDLRSTRQCYQNVIDQWITMAMTGTEGFDTAWTHQTPYYDAQVVLDNECGYFVEAFLHGYLGWDTDGAALKEEFELLAEKIVQTSVKGFIHRDLQSRNIMVQGERKFFIDFQGGRLGPIQYDLASLLIDPYADLAAPLQSELLTYAVEKLSRSHNINRDQFVKGYGFCALSRNLQILGAFAYLSRRKEKKQFEDHIPQAAHGLVRNLACLKGVSLPKLEKIAKNIVQAIER